MTKAVATSAEWYAFRVKSNREYVTHASLTGMGYETFLPRYKPSSGKYTGTLLPLFPGYIFCRLNIANRLPVLMLPGVVHVVSFGNLPTPLEEEEISSLQILAESAVCIDPIEYFSLGQKIRVSRGPLTGAVGIVTGRKRERLVVSLTLLQRSVAAELKAEWLDAGPEGSAAGFLRLQASA